MPNRIGPGRRPIAARLLFVSLLTALTAACSGQNLVNLLTPSGGYKLHSDIAYGNLPRQQLDVYVPKDAKHNAPTVVFFYGGRWEEGSKKGYKFVAEALTSRGFVAILPDYRLYPQVKFPTFVQDGAKAVAWAHKHAAEYGGDANKLFIMGHSAGAHIAAMLVTDPEYLKAVGGSPSWFAGFIGMAGPYDFLPLKEDDLKDMFGPKSQWPKSQPVNYVDGSEPPMLLMAGAADETVFPKNSRHLAADVNNAGGSADLKLYPRTGHVQLVASLAAPLRWLGPELDDVANFIRRIAANPPPVKRAKIKSGKEGSGATAPEKLKEN